MPRVAHTRRFASMLFCRCSASMPIHDIKVSGKIDYGKLIDQFGSKKIDEELMARMEKITVGSGRVKVGWWWYM